jgi:Protein of unknown function (DUF1549)/Protein of unknown function (DUF1553)
MQMHACLMAVCLLASPTPSGVDARESARSIDRRIDERLAAEHVRPAARADDAEFLRRLSLDLIGRIPTGAEVRAFLADSRADKRSRMIDRLLSDRQHAQHFARTWRALLLPEAEIDPRIAYFQPGFEAWLAERRQANVGFDSIVHELLAVPIARPDQSPQFVLRDLRRPNPIAFLAVKQTEPAKIATSCVRIFLGVRMECAQCHDHPFDHWTQRQFWSQAAFFAGLERRGRGAFAPMVEAVDRQSIRMGETDKLVPAALLDGTAANTKKQVAPRNKLADWITSPQNTYFSRTAVNRVWAQLMGRGLVDPVDDFRDSNPPSHPELMQELSSDFAKSGFDLTRLYRALCLTETYQRTSGWAKKEPARPELFAAMSLKSMSGEQFFGSIVQVIGKAPSEESGSVEGEQETLKREVVRQFAADDEAGYPKTSVSQALALMNGHLVSDALAPESGTRLKQMLEAYPNAVERQVDELYLSTLNRFPSADEKRMMVERCRGAKPGDEARRLADVMWVLLNSAEFRWNH